MRAVNGIHLANQGQWHIEQMLRAAKDRGAVTLLHFIMFPHDTMSDNAGDVENDYWYGKLRYGFPAQGIPPAPERLIHIRLYQANWADWVPEEVARRAVALLASWRNADGSQKADLWLDPFVCVSPCNEQNLEGPATRDYATQAQWQRRFWAEVDRLRPDRKALSCLGAWAFGGDVISDVPDSEYTVPDVRELCEYVDILATHPYALLDRPEPDGSATVDPERDGYFYLLRDFRPEGWRDSHQPGHAHDIGGILAQFQNKPLLITESGTFVHGDKSRTAETVAAMKLLLDTAAKSGRCLGVTWFIWNAGPEHAGNRIWYNEALRNGLEAMPEYTTVATVPVREEGDTMLQGIDVSHYQGRMDWHKAKAAGVEFAWAKVTEGDYMLDDEHGRNAEQARAAGVAIGPYHFYKAAVPWAVQVDWFGTWSDPYPYDLPVVIDLEDADTTEIGAEQLREFMESIGEIYGSPIVYTGKWWMDRYGNAMAPTQAMWDAKFGTGRLDFLARYPLWIADYTGAVEVPRPWTDWTIRQYSSKGNGPTYGAVSSAIDLDCTRLTLAELKALKQPTTPTLDLAGMIALAEAEHRKCGIRFNPTAAIGAAILSSELWPTTNEVDWDDDSGHYVIQRAEGASGAFVYWWDQRTGRVNRAPIA